VFRILLLFLTIQSVFAVLPDYEKEARWAEQVEESLIDGDIVWIKNKPQSFLSIYTEATTKSNKTALIIHGIGIHPNWVDVIQPLRIALTEVGFNTLSLQMPVLANDASPQQYYNFLLNDASNRIESAIKFLKTQNQNVDLIIAHSMGTVMASYFLANKKHNIKKYIAIGMLEKNKDYLKGINIPILDLYGNNDIETVLKSIDIRKKSAKNNSNYQQKMILGNHFFSENNELLFKTIQQWLNKK